LLADTSFLIDIMIGDASAVQKAAEIERSGSTVSVGSPTIFELYVGISMSGKAEEERSKIVSVLASLPQLSMDHASASAGGLIYGDRLKTGSRINPEDAMLAGIAKVHRETVVTRNVRHFKGIEGVTVESY
jgi:tRNA(fMet)-specific endonuclease VapC